MTIYAKTPCTCGHRADHHYHGAGCAENRTAYVPCPCTTFEAACPNCAHPLAGHGPTSCYHLDEQRAGCDCRSTVAPDVDEDAVDQAAQWRKEERLDLARRRRERVLVPMLGVPRVFETAGLNEPPHVPAWDKRYATQPSVAPMGGFFDWAEVQQIADLIGVTIPKAGDHQ